MCVPMSLRELIFKLHIFSAHGFSLITHKLCTSAYCGYLTTNFCRNAKENIALKINVMNSVLCFLIDSLAVFPAIIPTLLQDYRWAKICALNVVHI